MDFPIIDASKQSTRQLENEHGRAKALRVIGWYRVIRPAVVASIWLWSFTYIRWCVVNAAPEDLSLQALMPGIAGIGVMAGAIMLWTLGRHVERRMRRIRAERVPDDAPLAAVFTPALTTYAARRIVAYHDDDGVISHVVSMPDPVGQAA
jgi:hypothetical protein